MRKLRNRETYRLARSLIVVIHPLNDPLRKTRPASIQRLNRACLAIVHFICHSQRRRRKSRAWRLQRALAAAAASEVVLQRLYGVAEHRVVITAAMEVLERLRHALNEELAE